MAGPVTQSGAVDSTCLRAVQYFLAMLVAALALSCLVSMGWIPKMESCSGMGYTQHGAVQDLRSLLSFTSGVLLCNAAQGALRGDASDEGDLPEGGPKSSLMCLLW
mmetsp:Transcript_57844/g.169138  ORF Transcript_57844/g.169138 Transcript_57844/m.169138 type:complete len:106 (-) Transcript_57844:273-590(-)